MNVILSTGRDRRARRGRAAQDADAGSPVPGLDRRRIASWYAAFAVFAGLVAVFTRQADQSWGIWAAGGYLLAAMTAALWRRPRARDAALLIGAAGALAAPLTWLAVRRPATADVEVVARAAMLLVRQGSPYLGPGQLSAWRSYDPYLPAMSIFGLFRAADLPGVVGDPRLWLAVACVALLAVAFGVAAPHQLHRCAGCRDEALRRGVFAVTTPVLAMPLALGITDPPVLALFFVALACLGAGPAPAGAGPAPAGAAAPAAGTGWLRWPPGLRRFRPSRPAIAALAIGIACAMKITAWPALPVLAVMIAGRDGRRAAVRFAATAVVTAGAAIAVTAPGALTRPVVFVQNIVLYPLGLTRHVTPAASPLPGHLLAATGTAGHWVAIGLLLAAGAAVAAWIILRRPADARAAAWRLAVGLCVMFVLAPATRWGYFAYPLGLVGWLGLTGRDRAAAGRPAPVPARGQAPAPAPAHGQAHAPVPAHGQAHAPVPAHGQAHAPAPDPARQEAAARRLAWLLPVAARLRPVLAGLLASPAPAGRAVAGGSAESVDTAAAGAPSGSVS